MKKTSVKTMPISKALHFTHTHVHTHRHANSTVYPAKSAAPGRTSVRIHLETSEMLIVRHTGMRTGAAAAQRETRGSFHCTLALPGPMDRVSRQAMLRGTGQAVSHALHTG